MEKKVPGLGAEENKILNSCNTNGIPGGMVVPSQLRSSVNQKYFALQGKK